MDALGDSASGLRAAIVLFQAVVSAYVASVVGVAFIVGPHALSPMGLAFALLGLRYTLLPGVAGLIAAFLLMRRMRGPTWTKAAFCVLWGALVGFLWLALQIATGPDRHYFSFGTLAGVSYFFTLYGGAILIHVVPGAVGGLVFWLLTRRRLERYA
jgi:hypothetical protein